MNKDNQLFSAGFEAGVVVATQIMQGYEGDTLQAIINASHNIASRNLSDIMGKPEEDIALFIEPLIKPLQDTVDETVREMG